MALQFKYISKIIFRLHFIHRFFQFVGMLAQAVSTMNGRITDQIDHYEWSYNESIRISLKLLTSESY